MDLLRIAARVSVGLTQPLSERPDYGTRTTCEETSSGALTSSELHSPSSPKGDIPLTEHQAQEAYNAGYDAASYAKSKGTPFYDPTDAFLWSMKNDNRVPDIKEGDPSFWEWNSWVKSGAEDFNRDEKYYLENLDSDDELSTVATRVSQHVKTSYIKHEKGKGYCVKSEKNPDWSGGCFPTKGEAEKRLNEVEYFKRQGSSSIGVELTEHELIYIIINVPREMDVDEAISRAKALFPCKTGEFELNQSDQDWIAGNMQCEIGYYENNPDGAEYGPDEKGVSVSWETP